MHRNIFKASLYSSILILISLDLVGQSNDASHSIYLIGNAAEQKADWTDELIEDIKETQNKSTVYFLGDITDKDGINHKPKSKNEKRLKAYKKIEKKTDAKVYFLSGDRDWDNSGKSGKKKVNHLEKYIEKDLKLKKRFIPSNACPGPYVIEENNNLVVVAINSQWFIHPHERPEAPDTDCPIVFEADFWEELEDILDDSKDKNVLLLAHHPIYSFGQHNGKKLGAKHLIPFYGSFYASYKKNIGSPTDLAFPSYQLYIDKMRGLLHDYNSLIYASGHDFYNSILGHENNFFINTSISKNNRSFKNEDAIKYISKKPAFIKLNYDDRGTIYSEIVYVDNTQMHKETIDLFSASKTNNTVYVNNRLLNTTNEEISATLPITDHSYVQAVAGPEYKANALMTKWMGKNYRDEWTKSISVPTLDLQNIHGGLKPYARGGGLQTNSLKFKGGDGQNYVFRAVDKNPERALDELLKQTIYRKITKQLITTQHPYGGLVAAELLKATDILHATPSLFMMPDDPSLGIYKEAFGNVLGFLEIKPKTLKKKKGKTFGDADAIVSTHQMLRAMYNNHDHRMDPLAYAKARVFDMWIGDWDKHEDNWKWALFNEDGNHIYRPIPRDRDHVFSKWEGIVPKLSEKVVPNAENFGYHFGNLNQLNYKASNLDRRFGIEISDEQWQEAALYIQTQMTTDIIDRSIEKFPSDLESNRTSEIREKLISRRKELPTMINNYLEILHRKVNILGSNKEEYFEIIRLANGDVEVHVHPISSKGKIKKPFCTKLVHKEHSDGIYLFGLGGDDIFEIKGEANESIKIRIIPGKGKDEIIDVSIVKGGAKLTQVYQDQKDKDIINTGTETLIKRPFHEAKYDYHAYKLDGTIPFLSFQYEGYSGLGIILDVKHTQQGFNKPGFAKSHHLKAKYFPKTDAYRLQYQFKFRHLLKDWDFNTKHILSDQFDKYPFFWGIGSNTSIDEDLEEENYYRIDFDTYRAKAGLEKEFFFKSLIGFYLNYEYNEVDKINDAPSILDELENEGLNGLGTSHSLDLESNLKLDFRDHKSSSQDGSLLNLTHRLYYSLSNKNWGGIVDFNMSHYHTFRLYLPITIVGRVGTLNSYGSLPFYQRSILGNNAYLRGYNRNRFVDNHAAYFNIETRLEIGTWYNLLAPITYGIFGFHEQGSVWDSFDELSNRENMWRNTLGIGVFAAPLSRDFTFTASYAFNDESLGFFALVLGFDLDKI